MFFLNLVVLLSVVCLWEALLHYLPWRLLLRGNKLPRQAAYVLGMCAVMIPLSVWMCVYGYWMPLLVAWMCVCAAGVTVLGLYLFDYVVDLIWHKAESIEREQVRAKN